MACDCFTKINEQIAQFNTVMVPLITFQMKVYPLIQTEQVEKGRGKKKATTIFPVYCPFCGVKYDEAS